MNPLEPWKPLPHKIVLEKEKGSMPLLEHVTANAGEAFFSGYPIVDDHTVIHKYVLDKGSREYRRLSIRSVIFSLLDQEGKAQSLVASKWFSIP